MACCVESRTAVSGSGGDQVSRTVLNIFCVLILAIVGIAATGILDPDSYVEFGVSVPFRGLNLRDAPTNLDPSWATTCNNFIFDVGGALHVRPGLDQWNATTRASAFTFLSSYVDPSGQNWYVAYNGDTLYIPKSTDTLWTGTEFYGSVYNYDVVRFYDTIGKPPNFAHGSTTADFRKVLGAGDGLSLYLTDSTTAFTIVAVYEDTLIKLDRGNISGDSLSNQDYYIQTNYGYLNDVVVAQNILFLATTNGLYKFDGNKLTPLDTASYYGYLITTDSVTYEPHTVQANLNFNDVTLRWKLSTWKGSGSTPAFADGTSDGLWALNKALYVSLQPTSEDTASQTAQTRDHYYTMTYKILSVDKKGAYNYLETNGAFMRPEAGAGMEVAIYETEVDSSSFFYFLLDSVTVDSTQTATNRWFGWNKFWPSDSTWDSTRFETGDWFVGVSSGNGAQMGYTGNEYPIVGMVDSSGCFYSCGGPCRISMYSPDAAVGYAIRHVKKSSKGVNYKTMCVYKDRLWVVTADAPDQIKYSEPFKPDSLTLYQTIGLDLSDGDEIVKVHEMHGELYIFTRNSIYSLSGATIADFYLRKVVADLGCSAPQSFVSMPEAVFFAHNTGLYLFNGGYPSKISELMCPIIEDSINWTAAYDVMCAGLYRNHIWVSYPSGSSETNNRTLVYSLVDKRWGMQSFVAAAYHQIGHSLDSNEFMVSLEDSGSLCFLRGTTDAGDSIDAEYQTGYLDFGYPELKQILEYYAVYDAVTPVLIEVTRNDSLLYTSEIGANATALTFKEKRVSLHENNIHGRYLKIGIKLHTTSDAQMNKLTLGVVKQGKRGYDQ